MFLAGAFFAGTTLFGLAAANYVGQDAIRAADKGGNLTLPLLAQYLGGGKDSFGGNLMLGFVSAVAVATILAVVSALTLSTSGAIAHTSTQLGQTRTVDGKQEVWIARLAAVVIGPARNCARHSSAGGQCRGLVILAICVAASATSQCDPVAVLAEVQYGCVVGGMTVGLISSSRWR